MKELLLNAETLYTREQLHNVLAKVCGFPADYGRNLDALYDLLTAYPHFIKPSQNKLTANRLTVTFQNGNSIGVNTDGYVFVNGKLRAIKSGDGRNLYHDLFVLFYPTAKE